MENLLLLFFCMFGVARVRGSEDGATDKKFEQNFDRLLSMLEEESKRNVLFDLLKTRGRNKEWLPQAASNPKEDNGRILARLRDIAADGKEQISAEAELMDHDRRNAIQLANMVKHTTGSSPFDYLSYGCYCGLGGKGEPVDELDRCCLTHDRCYGKLTADYGCSEYWRYFNTYGWSIGSNGDIICKSDSNKCKEGQCLCDREMAECFQQHHTVYNDRYTGWWWTIWKKSREC